VDWRVAQCADPGGERRPGRLVGPFAIDACRGPERRLAVIGLDCRDGTPLIDIKPYFASIDAVPEAAVGWHIAEQDP